MDGVYAVPELGVARMHVGMCLIWVLIGVMLSLTSRIVGVVRRWTALSLSGAHGSAIAVDMVKRRVHAINGRCYCPSTGWYFAGNRSVQMLRFLGYLAKAPRDIMTGVGLAVSSAFFVNCANERAYRSLGLAHRGAYCM